MQTASSRTVIDLRGILPRQRHPLVFTTFASLKPGEAIELVNDHYPGPLQHQFELEAQGQFGWSWLEEGPDVWRVAIERKAAGKPGSGACGCACSCSGA